jgi:hypothetical protein
MFFQAFRQAMLVDLVMARVGRRVVRGLLSGLFLASLVGPQVNHADGPRPRL